MCTSLFRMPDVVPLRLTTKLATDEWTYNKTVITRLLNECTIVPGSPGARQSFILLYPVQLKESSLDRGV